MKNSVFVALFLFGFAPLVACALDTENEYGKFVELKIKDTYTVTFVLDPMNKKFRNIQEVSMVDHGDDEKGDVSTVLYRNGNKEVFFRNQPNYWRYVMRDASTMHVCGNEWSPKIINVSGEWKCSKLNPIDKYLIWWQIDEGLAAAKVGDFGALTERILENVKRISKK